MKTKSSETIYEESKALFSRIKELVELPNFSKSEIEELDRLIKDLIKTKNIKGTKAEKEKHEDKMMQLLIDGSDVISKALTKIINSDRNKKIEYVYSTLEEERKLIDAAENGDEDARKKLDELLEGELEVEFKIRKLEDE